MILIPTYNAEKCIEHTLLSLSNQTLQEPIWVFDNASSDATVNIVKKFPDVNLYQHKKNHGRIENWNFCLEVVKEKKPLFFKLLMAGDTLAAEANEQYKKAFESNENVGAVVSDFHYAEFQREPYYISVLERTPGCIPSKEALGLLSKINFMGSLSNIAFNADCLKNGLTFDHALGWASDYFFNIRVMKTSDCFYIDNALSTTNIAFRRFYTENRDSLVSKIEEFLVQQKAIQFLLEV
jgi:glycosyltransferase involved in cell wall biosynthesis